MSKYLGEEKVDIENSPFKNYKKSDWVLYFIERYGGIDGAHHKDWVLDQVCRILHGSNIIIKLASWDCGTQEWRVIVDEENPPKKYTEWIKSFEVEEDGEIWLNYDTGIAP